MGAEAKGVPAALERETLNRAGDRTVWKGAGQGGACAHVPVTAASARPQSARSSFETRSDPMNGVPAVQKPQPGCEQHEEPGPPALWPRSGRPALPGSARSAPFLRQGPETRGTHRSSRLACCLSLAATSWRTLRTRLWYVCGRARGLAAGPARVPPQSRARLTGAATPQHSPRSAPSPTARRAPGQQGGDALAKSSLTQATGLLHERPLQCGGWCPQTRFCCAEQGYRGLAPWP